MATKGIFSIQTVYNLQRSSSWPTTYQPATPPGELYGWFGGAYNVSSVSRIDYANDSGTATARGPLSVGRFMIGASGNGNYGWFAGGGWSPNISTVDRIDYSNDNATASVRGPLTGTVYAAGSSGNADYSWVGGGNNPTIDRIDRITYASDTGTASTRGPLSASGKYFAAHGNSSYGWYANGKVVPGPTPTDRSAVYRIQYASDTNTASTRGPLSSARYGVSATSNGNYGWFAGGYTSVQFSTIDRIDYASDTGTASVRGPMVTGKTHAGGTGTTTYGYLASGGWPTLSNIQRIQYSNDSVATSNVGLLDRTATGMGAVGGYAG
jgi:hypothetical protein